MFRLLLSLTVMISTAYSPSSFGMGGKQSPPSSIQDGEMSGTRLKEIVKWEDLSDQYVLGYGLDRALGKLVPFAIYDKTFSTPYYSHFWKILFLGSLEIGDINLAQLAKIIKQKNYKKHSKDNDNLLDILASRDFSSAKVIQVDENFWKKKTIIWKEGRQPNLSGLPPLRISFRDFDWESMLQERQSFSAAVESYDESSALLSKHEEIPLESLPEKAKEYLQDLEFLWNSSGFYEVHFPRTAGPIRPVKVIDLKNKYSSYGPAIAFATLTNIIKGGLPIIPFYGPPQVAAANMERAFDLTELLYLLRHSQALGLVAEALDNNSHSPFLTDKLTKQHLEDSVFYLLRASTLLSSIIKNAFIRNDKLAPDYIRGIQVRREQGVITLHNEGIDLYPIDHTYFGIGVERDKKLGVLEQLKIYALSYSKFARKTPMAAVDFLHPHKEHVKRNILQGMLYSSNFIYLPIPGISSIVKLLYKELVIREVNRRQMWESALLAHIHHSPNELKELLVKNVGLTDEKAQEYERLAVSIIENERMNPIDFDSEEGLAHCKKVEEWIKQRDPTYLSWQDGVIINVNDDTQSSPEPLQCVDSSCPIAP